MRFKIMATVTGLSVHRDLAQIGLGLATGIVNRATNSKIVVDRSALYKQAQQTLVIARKRMAGKGRFIRL